MAAIRSPMASSRSSANARRAASRGQCASRRAASRITSSRMGSGHVRTVVLMACSRPTPTTRASAKRRVHSSTASIRLIARTASRPVDNRVGRPTTVTPVTAAAIGHPVRSHATNPVASAVGHRHTAQPEWRFSPRTAKSSRRAISPGSDGSGTGVVRRAPSMINRSPDTTATPAMAASGLVIRGHLPARVPVRRRLALRLWGRSAPTAPWMPGDGRRWSARAAAWSRCRPERPGTPGRTRRGPGRAGKPGWCIGTARPSGPGPNTVVRAGRLLSPIPLTSSTSETNRCRRPPSAVSSRSWMWTRTSTAPASSR